MSRPQQQNLRNLQIERGDLYGQPLRSGQNAPRQRTTTPDERWDKAVASFFATLKSDVKTERSWGLYVSRIAANTAEFRQFPLRGFGQTLVDCTQAELDPVGIVDRFYPVARRYAQVLKEEFERATSVA